MSNVNILIIGKEESCNKLENYLIFIDNVNLFRLRNKSITKVFGEVNSYNRLKQSYMMNYIFLCSVSKSIIKYVANTNNRHTIYFLDKRAIKCYDNFINILSLIDQGYYISLIVERFYDYRLHQNFNEIVKSDTLHTINIRWDKCLNDDQWIYSSIPLIIYNHDIISIVKIAKNIIVVNTLNKIFIINLFPINYGKEIEISVNGIMLTKLNHYNAISSFISNKVDTAIIIKLINALHLAYHL